MRGERERLPRSLRRRTWGDWCHGILISAAVLGCLACGETDPETTTLARVGDEEISAAELLEYERHLPEHLRSTAEAGQARREYLSALVDRELLLLEAKSQGLEERPDVVEELGRLVGGKLVEQVREKEVTSTISVSEEEMRQTYDDLQMGWLHWPAHILSATEEDAWEVRRLLDEGADFATLARERSLAEDRERGGELRKWFDHGSVVPAIRDVVYDLPAGSITDPIQTFEGWEVIKILDRRRQPFEQLRGEARNLVYRAKWGARWTEYLQELKARYDVAYHGEAAAHVLVGLQAGSEAVARPGEYVVSYRGGGIDVETAIDAIGGEDREDREFGADSAAVFQAIDRSMLPDSLLVLAAREAGLDREPALLAWRRERLDEILVKTLRRDYLNGRIAITEEGLRALYEQIKDRFSLPGTAHITEVLVDTKEEALDVLRACRSGVPLEELAAARSVRSRAEDGDLHMHIDERGHMQIDPLRGSPYHRLLDTPETREVGKLQGPVEMEGRWAVFRVDEPIEPYYLPYDKVRRQVAYQLKKREANRLFAGFLDSIRTARRDDVALFDVDLGSLE